MKSSLLYEHQGLRTYALVMDKGEDPCARILGFAEENDITAAALTGIGACRSATLGYFDPELADYRNSRFVEQLEVLSMVGDIATEDDRPALHAHVVLGRHSYTTVGGHLQAAEVFPTMEIVLEETPAILRKRIDPETGLALIALDETGAI